MPRMDYDRLMKIAKEAFTEPYFLQTLENDPECFYGGYSKLRNGNTTGLEVRNEGKACHQGIWIDIMPLDRISADEEEREKQEKEILFYQRLLWKKHIPISVCCGRWTARKKHILKKSAVCLKEKSYVRDYMTLW